MISKVTFGCGHTECRVVDGANMTNQNHSLTDVLCVGHASFDLIMTVNDHPGPDEKRFADGFASCGGGPAANAAVTVVRMGGTAAFCGYLGNDMFGGRHLLELEEEGVDTGSVVRGPYPTPLSVILVKPDGQRTVVTHKGFTPVLDASAVDLSGCRPGAALFDGHEPDISLPFARILKREGIPVVLDAGSVHRGTIALAPMVDYLVASEKFARDYTGETDPERAVESLSRIAPFAVVTLGETGLFWKGKTGSGSLPAHKVQVVDTTGAGDVFHGAFALGVAQGLNLMDNLRRSSAAAALSCGQLGARTGIPQKDDVDAFLRSREKIAIGEQHAPTRHDGHER